MAGLIWTLVIAAIVIESARRLRAYLTTLPDGYSLRLESRAFSTYDDLVLHCPNGDRIVAYDRPASAHVTAGGAS